MKHRLVLRCESGAVRQEECANCQVRYDDDDEKRIFDAKEGAH